MALPTNRQSGDVISASDINAIATQVNTNTSAVAGKLNTSGGTMTGAINMGSKKITNLATPTNNTDACTKQYADAIKPTFVGNVSKMSVTTNGAVIYTNNLSVPVFISINIDGSIDNGADWSICGVTTPNASYGNTFTSYGMAFFGGNASVILLPNEQLKAYLYNSTQFGANYYMTIYKFGS